MKLRDLWISDYIPISDVILGGYDLESGPVFDVWTYFPGASCSTPLPNMPPSKLPFGVACFINGVLYASYLADLCMQLVNYNFSTKSWNLLTCTLVLHEGYDPYTCVGERIYYYNDNNPEYYDTMDKAWHYMAKKPMSMGGNAAAMCEANNRLYVFGGANTPTIQFYDINTDSWSVLGVSLSNNYDISCSKIPGTNNLLLYSHGKHLIQP